MLYIAVIARSILICICDTAVCLGGCFPVCTIGACADLPSCISVVGVGVFVDLFSSILIGDFGVVDDCAVAAGVVFAVADAVSGRGCCDSLCDVGVGGVCCFCGDDVLFVAVVCRFSCVS